MLRARVLAGCAALAGLVTAVVALAAAGIPRSIGEWGRYSASEHVGWVLLLVVVTSFVWAPIVAVVPAAPRWLQRVVSVTLTVATVVVVLVMAVGWLFLGPSIACSSGEWCIGSAELRIGAAVLTAGPVAVLALTRMARGRSLVAAAGSHGRGDAAQ